MVNVGNALANDFKPDDAFFVYILIGFVLVHLILFIKFGSCQIRSLFKIRAKLDVASETYVLFLQVAPSNIIHPTPSMGNLKI